MTALTPAAVLKTPSATTILIDGPNLYFSLRTRGCDMDFALLRDYLLAKIPIDETCSLQYISATWDSVRDPELTHPYGRAEHLQSLVDLGYTVLSKEAAVRSTFEGRRLFKSNMDAEIVTVMIEAYLGGSRTFVLFSSDSDFRYTIERLEVWGAQVFVVGSERSMTADYRQWLGCRRLSLGRLISSMEHYRAA